MRLLVVEDEKLLAEALCEIFKLNKYAVDVVHDGEDALTYISAIDYDCIVLDIMLPKLDGLGVLKRLRANKNRVPVILLTAKSDIDDKVEGLDCGADDYLAKPFVTKELLARIRAITRRGTEQLNVTLGFGNVTLNQVSYEISTSRGSQMLTNKEFQIMEMLLINQGRYISSQLFMDKVWGCDCETEINVVWTHISVLRKKLESVDTNIRIKSSRNLGYILEEILCCKT